MVKLSKRLQAVADMVTIGNRLADVGTDHGYIPIYLVANHKIPCAIAMDINKGPLLRAKEHIEAEKLEDYIVTRQSDGLQSLSQCEVDSIVIAGMGGGLIMKILEEGITRAEAVKELILQPQSDVEQVRRYLYAHGFTIVKNEIVFEDGKYYFVIKSVPKSCDKNPIDVYYRYGESLIRENNPVLRAYLEKEQRVYHQIETSLMAQEETTAIEERKRDLRKKQKIVTIALEEMNAL